ncbi:zinc finger protein 91-like isoform X1 [Aricia agestis]|uniref:zinc finger protein 91-like isoform X1 n=1 Tax=Aricia agestis TaxID=91739 RepID=UPI001C2062A4|nr:zinc finger protein 91-like isoform X1 [Aricia agestis]
MAHSCYYCPLCCNMQFTSKEDLVVHLSEISSNIKCPICTKTFSNFSLIMKHLKVDMCEINFKDSNRTLVSTLAISDNMETITNPNLNQTSVESISSNDSFSQSLVNHDGTGVSEDYVDMISTQLEKPCIQDQDLKFIKEEADGQYLILPDGALLDAGSVVTKQNKDGTISLNSINDDNNFEHETEFVALNSEAEAKEEIYSCNTCGVSFTSVSDHIQNYHTDQVVVVESNDEAPNDNGMSEISLDMESSSQNDQSEDRQTSRRMITETGDIVEEPLDKEQPQLVAGQNVVLVKDVNMINKLDEKLKLDIEKENKKKKSKVKEDAGIGLYYHKSVVMKDMETETGNSIQVYNCTHCHLYVTTLTQFQQYPCKKSEYPCSQCSVVYKNAKSLSAHMKKHKVKIPTMPTFSEKTKVTTEFSDRLSDNLECEICSTTFTTTKSFKLHKRMHDPIKSRPIEAPFVTQYGTTPSDEKYLCVVCDKMIPLDYRTIHENSHKVDNTYICDVCNKQFESRDYLDMHMTVHNTEKVTIGSQDKSLPYKCLYCTRKFARPHEKVKHERIHTGEKPHSCEICGKSFRVSYCLTLHMRTHTGARPYACPHCNKRFKAHSVFNHHLLTHSEVRAYKCPYCPKAFKTSVQLAGHKNSHTKPFACQQCNRPFASLYAVRVHMESHAKQNSLKFACALCGASYARAFALNDHVRQAHNSEQLDVKDSEWTIIEESIDPTQELAGLNTDREDQRAVFAIQ